MSSAGRQRAFEAATRWWVTAARALALVLALAVAMPTAGLSEDLAFHQDHPDHDRTELTLASDQAPASTQKADPGSTCHVHCGCHVALNAAIADQALPQVGLRPAYARVSEAVSSISPNRLPRPPRA